ncbi:unnamed protein product, partial [Rotaria magnacalcarata]
MIVESYVFQSLTNNHSQPLQIKQIEMAMNKLTVKQNGQSKMDENRTDDDYGGGGIKTNLPISS